MADKAKSHFQEERALAAYSMLLVLGDAASVMLQLELLHSPYPDALCPSASKVCSNPVEMPVSFSLQQGPASYRSWHA